jgi:hypothetical protein
MHEEPADLRSRITEAAEALDRARNILAGLDRADLLELAWTLRRPPGDIAVPFHANLAAVHNMIGALRAALEAPPRGARPPVRRIKWV